MSVSPRPPDPAAAAALTDLVAAELQLPADDAVTAAAAAIAARFGAAAEAVLFYGSGLRDATPGLMLDFYVIVSDYRQAYGRAWPALLNRWLPPNVYPFMSTSAAKYAVLDRRDFARLCSSRTRNPSVWARFAQPSRLVWVRDSETRQAVFAAVAQAAPALLGATAPFLAGPASVAELWRTALNLTFATELRAESRGRSRDIVTANLDRYDAFTMPALAAAGIDARIDGELIAFPAIRPERAQRDWRRRRWQGKLLSVARLVKAAATYDAGLDYLASKVARHSGTPIEIKPWHRRLPLLAGLILLPRLLWKGAVR